MSLATLRNIFHLSGLQQIFFNIMSTFLQNELWRIPSSLVWEIWDETTSTLYICNTGHRIIMTLLFQNLNLERSSCGKNRQRSFLKLLLSEKSETTAECHSSKKYTSAYYFLFFLFYCCIYYACGIFLHH